MLREAKTVEVCRVHKSFGGKKVVDDISFDVKLGEVFGMIGPNGAGKTTTIRMMMDIIKPDSGGVKILGEPILGLSLIILAGSIAVGIWFVAKVFRIFLLMYGKRPALREIIRYAREA